MILLPLLPILLSLATGSVATNDFPIPATACSVPASMLDNLPASIWYAPEVTPLPDGEYAGVMYVKARAEDEWEGGIDINLLGLIDIGIFAKVDLGEEDCDWQSSFKFRPGPDGCMQECQIQLSPNSPEYNLGCGANGPDHFPKLCISTTTSTSETLATAVSTDNKQVTPTTPTVATPTATLPNPIGVPVPATACSVPAAMLNDLPASIWYAPEVTPLPDGEYAGVMYVNTRVADEWEGGIDINLLGLIDVGLFAKVDLGEEDCDWQSSFKFRPGPDGCMQECQIQLSPNSPEYNLGCGANGPDHFPKLCISTTTSTLKTLATAVSTDNKQVTPTTPTVATPTTPTVATPTTPTVATPIAPTVATPTATLPNPIGVPVPATTCSVPASMLNDLPASIWYAPEVTPLPDGEYAGVMYVNTRVADEWEGGIDINLLGLIDVGLFAKVDLGEEDCDWMYARMSNSIVSKLT
jgi:hypothetical protein